MDRVSEGLKFLVAQFGFSAVVNAGKARPRKSQFNRRFSPDSADLSNDDFQRMVNSFVCIASLQGFANRRSTLKNAELKSWTTKQRQMIINRKYKLEKEKL